MLSVFLFHGVLTPWAHPLFTSMTGLGVGLSRETERPWLRIAAPPMGAQQLSNFDLNMAAERYRHILELGDQTGVTPMLEVWGHSKTLGTARGARRSPARTPSIRPW